MTSALAATALPLFRPPFPDGSRAFLTALFRVDSASWRPKTVHSDSTRLFSLVASVLPSTSNEALLPARSESLLLPCVCLPPLLFMSAHPYYLRLCPSCFYTCVPQSYHWPCLCFPLLSILANLPLCLRASALLSTICTDHCFPLSMLPSAFKFLRLCYLICCNLTLLSFLFLYLCSSLLSSVYTYLCNLLYTLCLCK